jgi:predicted neuraminidase
MEVLYREFLKSKTPTCHAGTICFYKDKPVYAFFGGAREGLADSCIYLQRGDDLFQFSNAFPALNPITQTNKFPCWNPILFEVEDRLFLFFKAGGYCDRWQTFYVDISNVWDEDFNPTVNYKWLPAGLNFCVKTKPIVKGNIVYCGSSVETFFSWAAYVEVYKYNDCNFNFAYRFEPLSINQKTISHAYGYPNVSKGLIQPTLFIDNRGKFNVFMRSDSPNRKIYHSVMDNELITWSIPKPIKNLDNPNSSIDVVTLNNFIYLVYNPCKTGRIPLVIDKLDEEFKTVDRLIISDKKDLPDDAYSPEFSYPYAILVNDQIHIAYTWGRKKIEVVTIGL